MLIDRLRCHCDDVVVWVSATNHFYNMFRQNQLPCAVVCFGLRFHTRAALGKALIISTKGGTKEAARAARFFAWTRTYRRTLRKVRALNALPAGWRGPVIRLYNALAWRLARKGL